MSQKTNPTSLRLQKTNKHFSSSWYSDYFYSQMNTKDLQIRSYLEAISKQIAQLQMFPYIQRYYKRMYTYLFLTDTREIRNQREKALRFPPRGHRYTASTTASVAFLRSLSDSRREMLPFFLFNSKEKDKYITHSCSYPNPLSCSSGRPHAHLVKSNASEKNMHQHKNGFIELSDYAFNMWKHNQNQTRPSFQERRALRTQIEKTSKAQLLELMPCWCFYPQLKSISSPTLARKVQRNSTFFTFTDKGTTQRNISNVFPVSLDDASSLMHQTIETTLLLAYERARKATLATKDDAYNFQKGKLTNLALTSVYPIRVVQDVQFAAFLAQEVVHLLQKGASFKQIQNRVLGECTRNGIIKGIRVSCSGRIGGRSKKAQKSKMQSVQWGETSLHVLSSKLSFASASASTSFGKVGIKLWLCFNQ